MFFKIYRCHCLVLAFCAVLLLTRLHFANIRVETADSRRNDIMKTPFQQPRTDIQQRMRKFSEESISAVVPGLEEKSNCYRDVWNYFVNNKMKFWGEAGTERFKEVLVPELRSRLKTAKGPQYFVDVGANIGQILSFISKTLDQLPNQSFNPPIIHLFEPNTSNLDYLRKRILKHKDLKIVLHENAVSNSNGFASFDAVNSNDVGNQHGRLGSRSAAGKKFRVRKTTLDSALANEISQPDAWFPYVKSDTEGFDFHVMEGAKKLLSKTQIYVFECHILQLAREGGPGTTHFQIQNFLSDLGFESFKISEDQILPFSGDMYNPIVDSDQFMDWQNCFAVRKTDPLKAFLLEKMNKFESCRFS